LSSVFELLPPDNKPFPELFYNLPVPSFSGFLLTVLLVGRLSSSLLALSIVFDFGNKILPLSYL